MTTRRGVHTEAEAEAKFDTLGKKFDTFLAGMSKGQAEIRQIAAFGCSRHLLDGDRHTLQLADDQGITAAMVQLVVTQNKPETKECATCCLASMASRLGQDLHAVDLIDRLADHLTSTACTDQVRDNVLCIFCNLSAYTVNQKQLSQVLLRDLRPVVQGLLTGTDAGKRAAAGLLCNLAHDGSALAVQVRNAAHDSGGLEAVRQLHEDRAANPEARRAAAYALRNLEEPSRAYLWVSTFALATSLLLFVWWRQQQANETVRSS